MGAAIEPLTGAVAYTSAGTIIFNVYRAGDGNYYDSAATADYTLTVNKAAQTISFTGPADQPFNTAPILLGATATSGLPVGFSVFSGPAELSGNALTLTGAGRITVRAAQAGDANYDPAPQIDRSFTVFTNFAAWRQVIFTAGELADPAISGPNAVYGFDGYANLVKYALGHNPKAPNTSELPVTSASATDWIYTYTRPTDRPDVTYTVEVSTNLTSWTNASVIHEQVSAEGAIETWRARYPLSNSNVFFRLKVGIP
jgi:hypothetical protein